MKRTSFLIDGFNLYHSARAVEKVLRTSTKWLNINSLCSSYLHLISGFIGKKVKLQSIYYFSALASHLEASHPDVTERHKKFIRCLKDTGIKVKLSQFKAKEIKCPKCGTEFTKHEEKETDVSIAIKLLEIFFKDECDIAVIVSGDTDLAPALKTAISLCNDKIVICAFPYGRKNNELANLAHNSFKINKNQYAAHQFCNPYILADGIKIHKPHSW